MTDLVARRDKGDKSAQDKINEAYGKRGGNMDMTPEGQAHLKEAVKTAKLKKATNDTGLAVNEVRLGGEDAMRDLVEYKKKGKNKKSMWAGE